MRLSAYAARRMNAENKLLAECQQLARMFGLPQKLLDAYANPGKDPALRGLRYIEAAGGFLAALHAALETAQAEPEADGAPPAKRRGRPPKE